MSVGAAHDAVVIGGGFYGSAIAIHLARDRGLKRVLLAERGPELLRRASYHNQARVHNGYHYPRSFTTAYRSRINLPLFIRDWPRAVKTDFIKLYAIARRNSKVSSLQFQRFCRDIGAAFEPAVPSIRSLFSPHLIEDVFVVQEFAFDATVLEAWASTELQHLGVDLRLNTRAVGIRPDAEGGLAVDLATDGGQVEPVTARLVFNCTYSGLNQLSGAFPGTVTRLKHEITEMALLEMPPELVSLGVTLMDGPFFSAMPFPARGLHTLSHVRYTPHLNWLDAPGIDPYAKLAAYPRESRADRMIRDAARYMPAIARARHVDSLFEVKTVLVKNEGDDGRPILFERHEGLPGCFSVLGGKIDNIYDVLERLSTLELNP